MANNAVRSLIDTIDYFRSFLCFHDELAVHMSWRVEDQQLADLEQRANSVLYLGDIGPVMESLENEISLWASNSESTLKSWMSYGQNITCFTNDTDMENPRDLQEVIAEFETIMANFPSRPHQRRLRFPLTSQTGAFVGFGEDLMRIKERLCNEKRKLQIIPIVGMGGIGKTKIASNVYNDPFVVNHFYIRAWITLSQRYRVREILLGLLEEIGVRSNDKIRKENDELVECIYKSMKGKRFLVVLDDVWSSGAWNDIKILFPNDNNGSRILLTTRLTDVAKDMSSPQSNYHIMRFLNEEESWNLFRQEVFGEENCPSVLVNVGMTIAKKCHGLPLAIVVIGGLLSKANKEKDYWEYVVENLGSIIAGKDDSCSEILTLSYNSLPPHLKPCFLYMGVFPENYGISVSRLIKLWVAEGFVEECQNPEEIAEEFLMELISRNLVLVNEKGSIIGKIKSCCMHDVLRELCVRMAHEQNFLFVKSTHQGNFPKGASFKKRLSIHDDVSHSDSEDDITMKSNHFIRSFMYFGWDDTRLHSYYYFGYLSLELLDMVGVELGSFPEEILQLVNLKYIAIVCHAEIPSSIVLLSDLQTLIVIDPMRISSKLPQEIWNMEQLRHLIFSRVSLNPPFIPSPFILHLRTLSGLDNSDLDILRRFPILRKLGLHCHPLSFHSPLDIGYLHGLETLKVFFDSPADYTFLQHITLPLNLTKITLDGGSIDWEYMTIFGSLPNLEVLKLRGFAFRGQEWLPNEGEFQNLKFLLIWETDLVHWRAENSHFPRLEHLIFRNCSNLVEIPSGIGEIPTLAIIQIDHSSPPAVASANQILEEQRDLGNDYLQVFVHPTKAKFYPLKFGIQQDESGRLHRRETKLESLRAQAPSGSNSNS